MSISVVSIDPNPTIQATHLSSKAAQALSGLSVPPIDISDFTDVTIFSGIVQCVFKGLDASSVTRDTLNFVIPDPNEELADLRIDIDRFLQASGTVSLASFAYDGTVENALWAADRTVVGLTNEDRGTGTANVQVGADLAVRGLNGIILRVNYTVFVSTGSGAITILT